MLRGLNINTSRFTSTFFSSLPHLNKMCAQKLNKNNNAYYHVGAVDSPFIYSLCAEGRLVRGMCINTSRFTLTLLFLTTSLERDARLKTK